MQKHTIWILLISLFLIGCSNTTSLSTEQDKPKETTEENESIQRKPLKEAASSTKQQEEGLSPLTVHYLDVGQGDATLFEICDGDETYVFLYDTGDWKGNEVLPYLEKQGIDYIDIIMISHPHADHIGQLDKILHQVEVGEVWMTSNTAGSKAYEKAVQTIIDKDIDFDEPTAGDVFDIGPLILTILHPDALTEKLNEDSLSFHAQYGDVSFLFTGDAYKGEERQMMERDLPLEASFLQLGHHGSDTSNDEKFIEKVNPEHAIYSAGEGNSYGHPHEDVVNLFQEKNIPLYGTDKDGTIIITTDGKTYDIKMDKTKTANKEEKPKMQQDSEESCIDINEANVEDLQKIIHVGETRAKQLIDLRPFDAVDDMVEIDGLGPARITDIVDEGKACVQ